MIESAYAMGQSGAGSSSAAGGLASFIPLILMFVIFYFLLIRPQQKKSKEHRQMIDNLKIGNRILIAGGIHGRVTGVSEDVLIVEITDKVKIKVNRNSVSAVLESKIKVPSGKSDNNEKSTN